MVIVSLFLKIQLIQIRNINYFYLLDWLKLRRDYRIVGELIGCLPKKPRQDVLSGLPLLLQPEEVSLLLEKNFVRLVRYPCLQEPPSDSLKQIFEEYRNALYIEQEECLRSERKKQVCGNCLASNPLQNMCRIEFNTIMDNVIGN